MTTCYLCKNEKPLRYRFEGNEKICIGCYTAYRYHSNPEFKAKRIAATRKFQVEYTKTERGKEVQRKAILKFRNKNKESV
jgi:hypothetical protein